MQPGKTKIKTGLCEPTVPSHQMRGANGAGRVGKVLRAKTQNFPCRWENHEWTTTAQARQITSEKFVLAAWAVRNFSPLLPRTKNTNFRLFHCITKRKVISNMIVRQLRTRLFKWRKLCVACAIFFWIFLWILVRSWRRQICRKMTGISRHVREGT